MRQTNAGSRRPREAKALHGLVEPATDLSPIAGLRVAVLVDEQNLTHSARRLGCDMSYNDLASRLRSVAPEGEFHLFTAADGNSKNVLSRFRRYGYVVHAKPIRQVPLPGGHVRLDANADNLFAFWAGLLALRNGWGGVVLASGDYGLAGELAQAIRNLPDTKRLAVMTLSLPGSTAQDLDARRNPNIKANLEIGLDLLRPIKRCHYGAQTAGSSRVFG